MRDKPKPVDKRILIRSNGSPSDGQVVVHKKKKVSWLPEDSETAITISFVDSAPFGGSAWADGTRTGKKGAAVEGKVKPNISGTFEYKVTVKPFKSGRSRRRPRTGPELIVDAGFPK
jgi:hypothetical protein